MEKTLLIETDMRRPSFTKEHKESDYVGYYDSYGYIKSL